MLTLVACQSPQIGSYAPESVRQALTPIGEEVEKHRLAQESLACSPSQNNAGVGDFVNHLWATSLMFVTSTVSLLIHAPGELIDRLIPDAPPADKQK